MVVIRQDGWCPQRRNLAAWNLAFIERLDKSTEMPPAFVPRGQTDDREPKKSDGNS